MGDQRHVLDHLPQPARAYLAEALEITGKRIRASEWLMDNTDWDLMASVWVERGPHAARALELRRARPPGLREEHHDRDRREGARHLQAARRRDRLVRLAHAPDDLVLFISDHGFQSVTRTIHMDHLLKQFGYLEFSASNVVFGPMQWGPVRNVARKVYDMLGLHGKVSLPQSVNWSKTKAFTTIRSTGEGVSINLAGREPDGIVDPADFEKVRDEVMDRLASLRRPEDRARSR